MRKPNPEYWADEIKQWQKLSDELSRLKLVEENEFKRLKETLGLLPELGNRDVITETLKRRLADDFIASTRKSK